MKVKIGQQVYTIYTDQIYLEEVAYLGKDSFIVDGYEDKTSSEYYYDDYGVEWFKDLEKAKKALLKKVKKVYGKSKVVIEQISPDTWEAYEDER